MLRNFHLHFPPPTQYNCHSGCRNKLVWNHIQHKVNCQLTSGFWLQLNPELAVFLQVPSWSHSWDSSCYRDGSQTPGLILCKTQRGHQDKGPALKNMNPPLHPNGETSIFLRASSRVWDSRYIELSSIPFPHYTCSFENSSCFTAFHSSRRWRFPGSQLQPCPLSGLLTWLFNCFCDIPISVMKAILKLLCNRVPAVSSRHTPTPLSLQGSHPWGSSSLCCPHPAAY